MGASTPNTPRAVLVGLALLTGACAPAADRGRPSMPEGWDVAGMVRETAPQHMELAPGETAVVASSVRPAPEWVLLEVRPADARTGAERPGGTVRALLHGTHGAWSLAYKGSPLYEAWMREIRSSLASAGD